MSMETAREFGYDVGAMENEIDRLRTELAVKDEVALGIMAALVQRNDTIARVRAWEAKRVWSYFPCVLACSEHKAAAARLHELFLHALDGDTE